MSSDAIASLKDEILMRQLVVCELEKALQMRRGTSARIPKHNMTRIYEELVAARQEKEEKLERARTTRSYKSPWLPDPEQEVKIIGASARLYSAPPRPASTSPAMLRRPSEVQLREQRMNDTTIAERMYYARMRAMNKRNAEDEHRRSLFRKSSSVAPRAKAGSVLSVVAAESAKPVEEFPDVVLRLCDKEMEHREMQRDRLMEKYTTAVGTIHSGTTCTRKTFCRLADGDYQKLVEDHQSLVDKYANGNRPVASKYAVKVSSAKKLDKIFERVLSRCVSR